MKQNMKKLTETIRDCIYEVLEEEIDRKLQEKKRTARVKAIKEARNRALKAKKLREMKRRNSRKQVRQRKLKEARIEKMRAIVAAHDKRRKRA